LKELSPILRFSCIALFLIFLHITLAKKEFIHLEIKQICAVHLFNFTLSIICFVSIIFLPLLKKQMGFSLLFGSVLKMLCLMVYLTYVILLLPKDENFVLQFVAVYFSYLFIDVCYAIQSLKIGSLKRFSD
jgi:hypothetical protein